jgi:MFS family permease
MFLKTKEKHVQRGNFFQLFTKKSRFLKFIGCIFIGLPIWFTIGILITFSPEFAKVLGIEGTIKAGDSVMYSYIGLAVGDLVSGVSSQLIGSRKKVLKIFILLTLGFILLYLFIPIKTTEFFYFACFCLGVGVGFWALFVTIAAEQFGTNLRSTTATTVPNFIRGTVIPLTIAFQMLREPLGIIKGALVIGVSTIIIAFIALQLIDETYGRDLNFEEID